MTPFIIPDVFIIYLSFIYHLFIIYLATHVPVEGGDVFVAGHLGPPLLDAVPQHQLVGVVAAGGGGGEGGGGDGSRGGEVAGIHVPDARRAVSRTGKNFIFFLIKLVQY